MIPDSDTQSVLEAIDRFDREFREKPEWQNWESQGNQKYAIEHAGKRYPPKKIISLATGAPVSSFSGGIESNDYLKKRDLAVVRIKKDVDPISEGLEDVLANYVAARARHKFSKEHSVAQLLRRLEALLRNSSPIKSRPHLKVRASYGQGNWATVPWIAFLDARETSTTRRGIYGVLLFRHDMSGVYITFNQGVTDILKELGKRQGKERLRETAHQLHRFCARLPGQGFRLDDSIQLNPEPGLGRDYEDSTIAHKLYPRDQVPQDLEVLADLEAVLKAYDDYLDSKAVTEGIQEDDAHSAVPIADLSAVMQRFAQALRDCNLSFGARHEQLVRAFVASLASKPFVILTGLSGSGKTQIAIRFGEWLGAQRLHIAAVRPDWTGAEALFGYEDALKPAPEGRPAWTVPQPLEFLLRAAADPHSPYVLVLDEMNLAHVERYFADVLSGMESGKECLPNLRQGGDGFWREREDAPTRIPFPTNVFVIGTVNVDETTYMFSPKVLDRANTFEFRVGTDDLAAQYRKPSECLAGDPGLVGGFLKISRDPDWHELNPYSKTDELSGQLRYVHRLLSRHGFEFGHRVFFEALRFAGVHEAAGDSELRQIMDRLVIQKILPRFHGSRRRLETLLCDLASYCWALPEDLTRSEVGGSGFEPDGRDPDQADLPISFDKLQRMLRSLRANQFTSFTE